MIRTVHIGRDINIRVTWNIKILNWYFATA